jgi:MFS family permease
VLIDISPLKKYRDYRLLYFGQMISYIGSMVSYITIPYQVYELTQDNAMVGAIGIAQLVPILIFGILGGTFADRLNRRRLLITSEILMSVIIFGLMLNALRTHPSLWLIFVLVSVFQAILGFHRPSMEALTQTVVDRKDYASIGALGSFRFSFGAIIGPALGGTVIAVFGVSGAYLFDFFTFSGAIVCLSLMGKSLDPPKSMGSALSAAKEGFHYALSKPELIGTYVIDIVAMVFAFPVALFPAMSQNWGGPKAAGVLFSAMATGSLVMTLLSGWTSKVSFRGRAVVIAALFWGVFIVCVGFSNNLWLAFSFLALAGAADMVSGIFRGIIWNESVPNTFRGRLSGIEMISYMTGPLLGNARAGWMAQTYSIPFSLISGGLVCITAVIVTASFLPKFWKYQSLMISEKKISKSITSI